MASMPKGMLDLGLAVLLSGGEVAVLVVLWFVEAVRQWPNRGATVPGSTRRFVLVLGLGSAFSALLGHGFSEAGLPVTTVSQTVLAALLALLLILVAGTEGYERVGRNLYRSRLRRERRRWHASQGRRDGHASPPVRRRRWPR